MRDENDKHMGEGLGDPEDHDVMKDPDAPPNALGDGIGASLDAALLTAERRRSGLEKAFPVPWADYATALGGGLWPGLHLLVGGTGHNSRQPMPSSIPPSASRKSSLA